MRSAPRLVEEPLEPGTAPREQASRPRDVAHRPLKGWRTVRELRDELRFSSDDACRKWLRRQGIVRVRRGKDGRKLLVDGLDVDRALRGR